MDDLERIAVHLTPLARWGIRFLEKSTEGLSVAKKKQLLSLVWRMGTMPAGTRWAADAKDSLYSVVDEASDGFGLGMEGAFLAIAELLLALKCNKEARIGFTTELILFSRQQRTGNQVRDYLSPARLLGSPNLTKQTYERIFLTETTADVASAIQRPHRVLGELIYGHRLRNGISQSEFASLHNFTQAQVSHWESGARKPNRKTFAKLAKILKLKSKEVSGAPRRPQVRKPLVIRRSSGE